MNFFIFIYILVTNVLCFSEVLKFYVLKKIGDRFKINYFDFGFKNNVQCLTIIFKQKIVYFCVIILFSLKQK